MAMDQVNVEIVAREVIKPSSPTLNHLRKFNLGLLDLPAPVSYEPLVFLYSNFRQQLTGSKTVSRLNATISGAVFVESRVSCLLSKFLEKPDAELLGKFIPVGTESPEALAGSLVLVQANLFACGGLAIGACISHKVADPVTFIKAWAAAAFASVDDSTALPFFNAPPVSPPRNSSPTKPAAVDLTSDKCVTKRVVFDASKIAALQAKAASESVTCPTRVEAVTALIWKCAMNASRSNSEHLRYSILSQSVDLRKRMAPPMPENTIGNLVGYFASCATECEIELQSFGWPAKAGAAGFHGRRQGFHGYQ
ncbi:N-BENZOYLTRANSFERASE PROTEIN putative-RELATED [Salix purpurea]|uniref:N-BENZOYLTRANSFERASE PROTEIN putative-RELATED n=1 Tax=Salix purpurea TaxID=77065 RepID=A0A9Q0TWP8_SALPP|nr:N-BENZOYLTRANSFERASE PROTEIN putative-RELATED [Salix purpurea]